MSCTPSKRAPLWSACSPVNAAEVDSVPPIWAPDRRPQGFKDLEGGVRDVKVAVNVVLSVPALDHFHHAVRDAKGRDAEQAGQARVVPDRLQAVVRVDLYSVLPLLKVRIQALAPPLPSYLIPHMRLEPRVIKVDLFDHAQGFQRVGIG